MHPPKTPNEKLNSLITLWQCVSGSVYIGDRTGDQIYRQANEKLYRKVEKRGKKRAVPFYLTKMSVHTNQIRQFCCETN